MQTFLPYPDFEKTVSVLDYKRLGKQRLEAKQIHNIITGKIKSRYENHPAVKMWMGYPDLLAIYYNTCITEWKRRGYKNTMPLLNISSEKIEKPWWFGEEKFHRSQRSRLIVKKEEFYLPKFHEDKDFNNGKYFWPDNKNKTFKII